MTRRSAPRLSVDEAFEQIISLAQPVGVETVGLMDAAGRVLRRAVAAARTQPPFDASAMDGYAVRRADAVPGAQLRIVAEIPAGAAAPRALATGEAMRIFTGAPVPAGADAILLQEDADPTEENGVRRVLVREPLEEQSYIRPAGGDFTEGGALLSAPTRLTPEHIALAAAAGMSWLDVARCPRVTLLSIGDELALPGDRLGPSSIISSNGFGVAALVRAAGGVPEAHPLLSDDPEALNRALKDAQGSDVIVTLGGASDGDHDLAKRCFAAAGAELGFHKIAMRPGKPLMAGRMGNALVLGLPGNPVSALVCARLFLTPALDALLGLPALRPARRMVRLGAALSPNGPREHYMRATLGAQDGALCAFPAQSQDSSLLSVLATADVLLIRPPKDPPRAAGDLLPAISLNPDASRMLDESS